MHACPWELLHVNPRRKGNVRAQGPCMQARAPTSSICPSWTASAGRPASPVACSVHTAARLSAVTAPSRTAGLPSARCAASPGPDACAAEHRATLLQRRFYTKSGTAGMHCYASPTAMAPAATAHLRHEAVAVGCATPGALPSRGCTPPGRKQHMGSPGAKGTLEEAGAPGRGRTPPRAARRRRPAAASGTAARRSRPAKRAPSPASRPRCSTGSSLHASDHCVSLEPGQMNTA